MTKKEIEYWRPRVMRHPGGKEGDTYAIHEVYYDEADTVVTYTEDALTPKEKSVTDLKIYLLGCLAQENEEYVMGDSQYTYTKEDIEFWLRYIDESPINFLYRTKFV